MKIDRAGRQSIFSKLGVDRILRFAFELALKRPDKHLTSATKSNGIKFTMPFWDERFEAIGQAFTEVRCDKFHIDILTAYFVQHPDWFDVVVGSHLFGDVLSDLGPAVAGGISIAPSANLNIEKRFPSMFEPVHGSAPDIAGKGIANPIATLWSVQMMLDFLGQTAATDTLMGAIKAVTGSGFFTPDLGGTAATVAFTDRVLKEL
ncbi:MAG: isocitrate/isopropylmalate family dehydrogenase [Desulfobacterales bacterium]